VETAQLLEPPLEGLCRRLTVELQVDADVVRIVDGSVDLIAPHAPYLATGRVAVEGRLPSLEVADGMLDLQNGHGGLLSGRTAQ